MLGTVIAERAHHRTIAFIIMFIATALLSACDGGATGSGPTTTTVPAKETPTPTLVPALLTATPTPTVPVEERTAPTPSAIVPQGTAPMGLAKASWPEERGAIEALLGGMPQQLAGMDLGSTILDPRSDRLRVSYGPPDDPGGLQLTAVDLTSGEFFPVNWTARDIVAQEIASGDTFQAGRDGALVWSRNETVVSRSGSTDSITMQTIRWGPADSSWVLSAAAPDQESLEQLLSAAAQAATTE